MQQNVMNFMTVFMGVMFYKVPAGLCLYFITSSLWGICERKFLPKPKPGETLTPPTTEKKEKKESKAASAISGILGLADAQLKEAKNIPSTRKKQKKG
jgi:YidC/Oxa1 family membrane protein insertase